MRQQRDLRAPVWQVADLIVDSRARSVRRGDERIKLPRLSLDLLLALVEAAPDALSTDELMTRVWKGVVVSQATVAKRVELLRHALGDASDAPRYIALEHGFGYRLVPNPVPADRFSSAPPAFRRWLLTAAVLALLMVAGLAVRHMGTEKAVKPPPERSIALLPFKALGDAPEDQLFADGLTEELGRALASSGQLRVTGRSSSFQFRDASGDTRAIGEALGVAHLLEGTVRRDGQRLRVVARLLDTADGTLRWSEAYDQRMADLIEVQSKIAERAAAELNVALNPDASDTARPLTNDPDAYALYLTAVSLMEYPFGSDLPRAQVLLEQAVTLDPDFARAWSWLASVHLRRMMWEEPSYELTAGESLAVTRDALDRALGADPEDGWAYAVLAALAWVVEDDIAKAAQLTQQAGRLLPHDLNYQNYAADVSRSLGQLELALRLHAGVLVRDPLCTYCRISQVLTLNALGRHDEAERAARLLVRTEPESDLNMLHLGRTLLLGGKPGDALEAFQAIGHDGFRLAGLAMAQYSLGEEEAAREHLEALEYLTQDSPGPYIIAQAAAWLGYQDRALALLNQWVAHIGRVSFQVHYQSPIFKNLHGTAGWARLLERIGRSPEQLEGITFLPVWTDPEAD